MNFISEPLHDMEQEIHRIWILVSELSDQLAQNNRIAAELHAQIQTLKEQADSAAKTTTLRRFNTNLASELFDSELERSTVSLILENQGLLQENKQLNSLMTDYEQTLRTVMTKFRQYVQAASEKEMSILRHYDTLLVSSEGQPSTQTYNQFNLNASLERLRTLLHIALQNDAGIDPEQAFHEKSKDGEDEDVPRETDTGEGEDGKNTVFDWAVEREAEIARLEKENEELRRQLGILDEPEGEQSEQGTSGAFAHRHTRTSSAPFGAGFTTSSGVPSPQPSSLIPNPFAPSYPGAQGYNPPSTFNQQDRRFPPQSRPLGPAPPQITPRTSFGEGSMNARQQPPAFPSFFRGGPPRDRVDLGGPTLL